MSTQINVLQADMFGAVAGGAGRPDDDPGDARGHRQRRDGLTSRRLASSGPGRDPPFPDRGLRAPAGRACESPGPRSGTLRDRGFLDSPVQNARRVQLPRIVAALRLRLPMTER